MKTTIGKAISLGFGLAAAGKEQIEKTMDDLVKKGEVSREESKTMMDQLIVRGEETKRSIEGYVKERIQSVLADMHLATTEQLEALERRVQLLEHKESNP